MPPVPEQSVKVGVWPLARSSEAVVASVSNEWRSLSEVVDQVLSSVGRTSPAPLDEAAEVHRR